MMRIVRRIGGGSLGVGLLMLCCLGIQAQPVVYQATGTREQIQPTIDQFTHDVIYGIGGSQQNPPPQLGSFRMATFDDATVGTDGTTQTRVFSSGGLTFANTVWPDSMILSAGTPDATNPNRLFGDINSSYPSLLDAFSNPSVLGFRGDGPSAVTQVAFLTPSIQKANAFGAVFVNVEIPGSALLVGGLISSDSFEWLPFAASSGTDGGFSFLGVILEPNQVMTGLEIFMSPLQGSLGDVPADFRNRVAVDNVIVGLAPPLPEPSSMVLLLVGGCLGAIILRYRQKQ